MCVVAAMFTLDVRLFTDLLVIHSAQHSICVTDLEYTRKVFAMFGILPKKVGILQPEVKVNCI